MLKNKHLYIASIIIFIVFYTITAFLDGLTPDDLHFWHNLNTQGGVWKATLFEYNTWSTRVSSVYFNHLFLSFADQWWMLPLRHTISFTLLFLAIKTLLKNTVNQENTNIISSFCLSIVFYFSILDLNSTWYWHCASFTYIWTLIALIGGIGLVLKKQPKLIHFCLVALSFFYIGSSFAPGAFFSVLVLTALILFFKNRINNTWIYGMIFLLVGLTILLLGPGNDTRINELNQPSILGSVWINMKSLIKIYLFYFPSKIIAFSIIAMLANVIGQQHQSSLINRKQVILVLLTMLSATFIYHLPIAYIMGEIGPSRTFSFISLIHVVGIFYIFYHVRIPGISEKMEKWTGYALLGICSFYLVYTTPTHYQYSKALKERYGLLKNDNHNTEKIHLIPELPCSGLYMNGEITDNKGHFLNQHIRKYFHLSCFPCTKK